MTQEPPAPLNYQGPQPGRRPPVVAGAIAGIVLGCLLSFLAYWRGFSVWPVMIAVVLLVKIGAGVGLMRKPASRGFGIGVLVSIALGALIFFGVCASNFKIE